MCLLREWGAVINEGGVLKKACMGRDNGPHRPPPPPILGVIYHLSMSHRKKAKDKGYGSSNDKKSG